MNFLPKTLRGQLVIMIIFMGIITVTSASVIIETFWGKIVENDRQNSQELLRADTLSLLHEHRKLVLELSTRLGEKKELKNALKSHNLDVLTHLINEEFFQYYVTAEILDVKKIYIFNKKYELITQSTEGDDLGNNHLCKNIITHAKPRKGIERLKSISTLCSEKNNSLFSSVSPIGTLSPIGYIQIVTDPIKTFAKLSSEFHMQVKINGPNNNNLYQSTNWEQPNNNLMSLNVIFRSIDNKKILNFQTLKDITKLNNSFKRSRNLIIIFVSTISIITIIIFYKLMDKSMMTPIRNLIDHLSNITTNNKILNKSLTVEGSEEMRSLTHNFNLLTNHLSQLYKSLENMAFIDQLTTLPNRSRLKEVLQFHHDEFIHRNIPYSLLMMDLDRFKSVNDTLGHQAGDKLLQKVSERLSKVLRKTDYISVVSETDFSSAQEDLVARLGGDEFAAVLPAASEKEDIQKIAEKIIRVMEEPFVIDDCHFSVGISIGIAQCPLNGDSPDALMRHADVAMYSSKNNNAGFTFYEESIDDHSIKMLTLVDDLKLAIKTTGLELLYQPKIDLQSNKLIGAEALIRWHHAEHGLIFPDQFIPKAEQSGIINDLTLWVLSSAIAQLGKWKKTNPELSIAINLSPKNLLDSSLIPNIKNLLVQNNVLPESLFLEITETAIMSNPSRSIIVLQELYDLGVRVSIDDFGTGYSSLSYLKKLPADEIKIDRSFVMDMDNDINDAIIVRSTIDLAHNMGLRVVAEGVETQPILDQLSEDGCDYAQGYHIAKPMSIDDFERSMLKLK